LQRLETDPVLHRHVATRVGDPMQLLHATSLRLVHFAAAGVRVSPGELAMRAQALRLAEKVGPDGIAYLHGTQGLALHIRGEMKASLDAFQASRDSTPSGVISPNFRIFEVWSLLYAGRLRAGIRLAKRLLREVDEDGDVYSGVCLRAPAMIEIAMIEDDPAAGHRYLDEAAIRWQPPGFTVQHWYMLTFGAHLALYEGQAEAAYQRMVGKMRLVRRSYLLKTAAIRRHTMYMVGRAAIASAAGLDPSVRRRRLAEAEKCARTLERMRSPVDRYYAHVLRGALANAEGRSEEAAHELRAAIALGDETGPLYAWTAQYQLGRLLGGDEGRALSSAAEKFFADEGVRAPARYAAAFVPGDYAPPR
jgi:hypothetical protein